MLVVMDFFAVDFVFLVVLDMVAREGSLIIIFFAIFVFVVCFFLVMRTLLLSLSTQLSTSFFKFV